MGIVIFIVGLCLGSFANVLIYRLPLDKSILFPFSFCPSCGTSIKWYHNIPLLSYIFLGGRCSYCKQKISIIYPVVELFSGLLSLFLFLKTKNLWLTLILFNLCFCLLVIAVVDYKTMEVPVGITYYLIVSCFLFSFLNSLLGGTIFIRVSNSLIGGIFGLLLLFLIEFLGKKVFKKSVIGFADVKMFCGIGLTLGIYSITKILFFSSVFATIFIVFLYIKNGKKIFGKYIPFAPFIFLGTFMYILVNL